MLTEQDYQAIAIILGPWVRVAQGEGKDVAIGITQDLAAYFAVNNPKFDRKKFLGVCSVPKNPYRK